MSDSGKPNIIVKQPVWVVYVNEDLNEGRGADVPTAVCLTEGTASRLAEGAGVQGWDGRIVELPLLWVTVNDHSYPYGPVRIMRPTKEDEQRQRALDETKMARARN